jgi:hypothetical protein
MESTEGYNKAVELLFRSVTPLGFVASPEVTDNYKRVWTRDGVVTGLAALATKEPPLIECFRKTLQTVLDHQHPSGFIPSNVSEQGKSSYGGTVGRADNPSWAVAGLCMYALYTNDIHTALKYKDQVEKCFHVLDIWEYNGKHLIYVPQSGDWADEYFYHGYVLFDQLLRVWALNLAGKVFQRPDWIEKATVITQTIQKNFWKQDEEIDLYAANLRHQLKDAPDVYWFMGFNPGAIYTHFDLQANSLALLLSIGNKSQDLKLTTFIKDLCVKFNSIVPSFHPAVNSEDIQMENLKNNYAYSFRNFPHQFHNGGLWPVWNGFAAAALVLQNSTDAARILTDQLHAANAMGGWNFNECLHGQTKQPIGVSYCTWSAAGAVIAETAIMGNSIFNLK